MEQAGAARECPLELPHVAKIALHDFRRQLLEIGAVRAVARQHPDLPARVAQASCDRRAHEPGCTGDQRLHAVLARTARGAAKPARAAARNERRAAR